MNFNFELVLFYITIACGLIALLDIIFLAPRRKLKNPDAKYPVVIDYARSFFPVLLLVFLLRAFLYEPFRIPSGSLEPTLMIGDFILVNKFKYGLKLPVLHKKMLEVSEPKRGDIFVFRWPPNPDFYFIKRIIGLPGDHVTYVDKVLTVNGQKIDQTFENNVESYDESGNQWHLVKKQEDFFGIKHSIYQVIDKPSDDFDVVVPEGMYFAMGDNRDDSADSRYWGFVPKENIVGRADIVWMSWAKHADLWRKIEWSRIGRVIH